MSPLRLRVADKGKIKKYFSDDFSGRFHSLLNGVVFLQLYRKLISRPAPRGFRLASPVPQGESTANFIVAQDPSFVARSSDTQEIIATPSTRFTN